MASDARRREQRAGAPVYGRDRAVMVYRGAVALIVLAMGLALAVAQGATATPPNSSTSIVQAAGDTLAPMLIATDTPIPIATPTPMLIATDTPTPTATLTPTPTATDTPTP